MSELDVFVSVGSTATEEQEAFVRAVEDRIRSEGLVPHTVGRNTWSADSPLKSVMELIATCAGAVVIALERSYFAAGTEKRGGPNEVALTEVRLPTPWNQIEAAMAYARGLPLLVIVDAGLKSEGLLEQKYDWYVQRVRPEASALNSAEFNGVLASWKQKMARTQAEAHSLAPAAQPLPAPDSEDSRKVPISDPSEVDKLDRPIRILFLAANPIDTVPLRLDEEMRAIDRALREAQFRDRFEIEQQWAVRIGDLQEALLRFRPDIVHFSGHGTESSEIVLQNESGTGQVVPHDALGRLFSVLRDNIRCVVLNACYSEQQAQAIADHIDCVVGMTNAVGDDAAVGFATAFYRALGYGRDIQTAFDLGTNLIGLQGLPDVDTPHLVAKQANAKDVSFVSSG